MTLNDALELINDNAYSLVPETLAINNVYKLNVLGNVNENGYEFTDNFISETSALIGDISGNAYSGSRAER